MWCYLGMAVEASAFGSGVGKEGLPFFVSGHESASSPVDYKSIGDPVMLTVRVRSARVRQSPDPDAQVIWGLEAGERVGFLDAFGAWYHIEFVTGRSGWVHRSIFCEKITVFENSAPGPGGRAGATPNVGPDAVIIVAPSVWMADAPAGAQQSGVLLSKGDRAVALSEADGWKKVQVTLHRSGWIHENLIGPILEDGNSSYRDPEAGNPVLMERGNLRTEPNREAFVSLILHQGEAVKVLEKTTPWIRVKTSVVRVGWVPSDALSIPLREGVGENPVNPVIPEGTPKNRFEVRLLTPSVDEEEVLCFQTDQPATPEWHWIQLSPPRIQIVYQGQTSVNFQIEAMDLMGRWMKRLEPVASSGDGGILNLELTLSPGNGYGVESVSLPEKGTFMLILRPRNIGSARKMTP
jgi:SH3-like domain-containing protein